MNEEKSVFDNFLAIAFFLFLLGVGYFLYKRNTSEGKGKITQSIPESRGKKELEPTEIDEVVKSWLKEIGVDSNGISSLKSFAKRQVLEDLLSIIKDQNLSSKQKKEKILEIANKDYSIDNKIEKLKLPNKLRDYDTIRLGSYSYFFKEYSIPYDDITTQNIEEKLKVLFKNIYDEGLNFIKSTEIFLHIKYLEDKETDEEIQKKLEDIKFEVEYQLKFIDV